MSAYGKIPLQALILLIGVLVFVVLPVHAAAAAVQPGARDARVSRAAARPAYAALERRFDDGVRRAARGGDGAMRRRGARGDAAAIARARQRFQAADAAAARRCGARRVDAREAT